MTATVDAPTLGWIHQRQEDHPHNPGWWRYSRPQWVASDTELPTSWNGAIRLIIRHQSGAMAGKPPSAGYARRWSVAELSPAARAAMEAFNARHELCGPFDGNWVELCLAAALHALANHQSQPRTIDGPQDWWDPDDRTRRELRNLAGELESTI